MTTAETSDDRPGRGPDHEPDAERARRAELLAAAERQPLLDVADACLDGAEPPQAVLAPEVGALVLTVREPVEATRFQLADVLVTRSEVVHRGAQGWAMRMGEDRAGALAAAICDAECEADGPARSRVDTLCRATARRLARERRVEWEQLRPTIVEFEEMSE